MQNQTSPSHPPGDGAQAPGPIRFRCFLKNTILDVLLARGWRQTEDEREWDFAWHGVGWMKEKADSFPWEPHQRVCHFRNMYALTRKDNLLINLKRAKRALEKEGLVEEAAKYDFFPTSFFLPQDYGMFVEEFRRNPNTVWIMKPVGSAQGKGIFLFSKLQDIAEWRDRFKPDAPQAASYVVQRYISNPYLIGGKKFDLRMYALVTSYSPLVVYIYRDGFARFSNRRFTMDLGNMQDLYIHLTNVAIQKQAPDYDRESGIKWGMRQLRVYLTSKHGQQAADGVFREMQNLVLRSLLSVQQVMINDKHCFELYGYDILIDDQLHLWLLEVNASPSLSVDTPADYELKFGLLSDMLDIVDMEGRFPPLLPQVGGFDLVYNNGFVPPNPPGTYASFIGCHNDRVQNLKKLYKQYGGGGGAVPSSGGTTISLSSEKK